MKYRLIISSEDDYSGLKSALAALELSGSYTIVREGREVIMDSGENPFSENDLTLIKAELANVLICLCIGGV